MQLFTQPIHWPLAIGAMLTLLLACNNKAAPVAAVDADERASLPDGGIDEPSPEEVSAADGDLPPDTDEPTDASADGDDEEPTDASADGDDEEPTDGPAADVDSIPGLDADEKTDADPTAVCAMVCARELALACPRPIRNCDTACPAILAGPCGAPWSSFFSCSVARPVSDFFCSPQGQSKLKDGLCVDESALVDKCVKDHLPPSP